LPGWSARSRCSGGRATGEDGATFGSATGVVAGDFRSSDFPRASTGAGAGGRRVTGGAIFASITLTAGAAAAGFNSLRAASSSGLPGLEVNCGCWAVKPIGAGGGAVRATTGRSSAREGGLLRSSALPRTLRSVGATTGTTVTGALTITSCDTRTAVRDTGCDCTKAVVGTATTAPWTRWFA
jgi:hypothetical protein